MRYITGFAAFLVLILLDILLMLAAATVIIGLFLGDAGVYRSFPYSAEFAKRLWLGSN